MNRTVAAYIARLGIVMSLLGLTGCANEKPTGPSALSSSVAIGLFVSSPSDPLQLVSAKIRGDVLFLEVMYGGGCHEHRFALTGGGVFMESYPVQTGLTLHHDALGDLCRAIVSKSLQFDLTPLKHAYQRSYQTPSGVMIIHLAVPGHRGKEVASLRYEFAE